MAEKQITFKGFPLDSRGDVIGAFPSVDVIQEQRERLINTVADNINQLTIDYCLKFNIDPDVLIKQKAEIELLLMKIEKMKNRCNCKNGWYSTVGKAGFGCNLNIEKCEGCIKWELAE